MRRITAVVSSLLLVCSLTVALTTNQNGRAGASPAAAGPVAKVVIQGFAFSPATLTVAPGTTVIWTNQDSVGHTVTSDSNAWTDSGSLATGKSFSHTFSKAGTYAYHCAVHPSMIASIVVSAMGGAGAMMGTPLVKLAATHMLVTNKGMTLYVFALDGPGKSACTATCAKYWPPLLAGKGIMPEATMAGVAGTFGLITRSDGTRQITFDHAPLYTFLLDKKPGNMFGQGQVASGGYWWAVAAASK